MSGVLPFDLNSDSRKNGYGLYQPVLYTTITVSVCTVFVTVAFLGFYNFAKISLFAGAVVCFLSLGVLFFRVFKGKSSTPVRPSDTDLYYWLSHYSLEDPHGIPPKSIVDFFANVHSVEPGVAYPVVIDGKVWSIYNVNKYSDTAVELVLKLEGSND